MDKADAKRAARQVAAGEPGPSARRWLGPLCVISFALFVLDTWLVLNGTLRMNFDLPVELWVQSVDWGPLAWIMVLTNESSGLWQYLLGALAVIALLIYERRAGYLMALGAVGSLIDAGLKASIARGRPTADLVQILNPSNGYSYPSGHAVFFTWLCFMGAVAVAPRLHPRRRILLWAVAGFLTFLACLGRVWAGAHWPTDVIGGFLLAICWSAFVLWLPERWLPSPTWSWIRGRRRQRAAAER